VIVAVSNVVRANAKNRVTMLANLVNGLEIVVVSNARMENAKMAKSVKKWANLVNGLEIVAITIARVEYAKITIINPLPRQIPPKNPRISLQLLRVRIRAKNVKKFGLLQ